MYLWDGKNVYFMGFMATGKSRVGEEFARLLGWPFFDADSLIEKQAGKSINTIFAQDGSNVFRKLESDIIFELSKKKHRVIALGGGAVVAKKNWQQIKNTGVTICLSATPQVLFDRISRNKDRPLMNDYSAEELLLNINTLLQERLPIYELADYTFESCADVTATDLAMRIFEKLRDEI